MAIHAGWPGSFPAQALSRSSSSSLQLLPWLVRFTIVNKITIEVWMISALVTYFFRPFKTGVSSVYTGNVLCLYLFVAFSNCGQCEQLILKFNLLLNVTNTDAELLAHVKFLWGRDIDVQLQWVHTIDFKKFKNAQQKSCFFMWRIV